jgi:hypothetical protein
LPVFNDKKVEKVKEILQNITGKTYEELDISVTAAARAEVLFRVESFLDKNPRKVFDEEFIFKLNEYRSIVVREELKKLKEKQKEAELMGDEVAGMTLSSRIGELSKLRQAEPYTFDLLN